MPESQGLRHCQAGPYLLQSDTISLASQLAGKHFGYAEVAEFLCSSQLFDLPSATITTTRQLRGGHHTTLFHKSKQLVQEFCCQCQLLNRPQSANAAPRPPNPNQQPLLYVSKSNAGSDIAAGPVAAVDKLLGLRSRISKSIK